MAEAESEVQYEGELFRLRTLEVEGAAHPYEFVDRRGAVTVLPVMVPEVGGEDPKICAIVNERRHYGVQTGLPGGNLDGTFDAPEPVIDAALREVAEEVGLAPEDLSQPNVEVFLMRPVSSTIAYNRFFAVARGLVYVGGEEDSPAEKITQTHITPDEYLDPILALDDKNTYPEVALAFSRAEQLAGRAALDAWLLHGDAAADADEVVASFAPWMTPYDKC